jgi:hypothetical protein
VPRTGRFLSLVISAGVAAQASPAADRVAGPPGHGRCCARVVTECGRGERGASVAVPPIGSACGSCGVDHEYGAERGDLYGSPQPSTAAGCGPWHYVALLDICHDRNVNPYGAP